MKKLAFEIDASLFTSRKEAHAVMKKTFEDYEYYGNNLDALHDVLTSIRTDAEITMKGIEESRQFIGDYTDRIMRVFSDSTKENPHLTVIFLYEE